MWCLKLLAVLPLGSYAARVRTNSTRGVGRVSHMFTWGAPHPTNPMLTTKEGGCFQGYRITNGDDDWLLDDEDIVPTLLTFTSYNHPDVQTLVVVPNGNGIYAKWACGKNPFRVTRASALLHMGDVYQENMAVLDSSYERAKVATRVGLKNSYVTSTSEIKANLRSEGWNLVGTASAGEDVSHLIQDPSSLRCILTFEGSDSFGDWVTDAQIIRKSFCGTMWAHRGFTDELRRMVGSSSWQTHVRPKLGKCSAVDAVGHSLGGAVATLFTGCVDWQNGSDDYNLMSWNTQRATRMSSL